MPKNKTIKVTYKQLEKPNLKSIELVYDRIFSIAVNDKLSNLKEE
jgi:hypothetical protein